MSVRLENEKKWVRKLENQSYEKWSEEGQDKSTTSLRTSYNTLEHKWGDISPPSAFAVAAKLQQFVSFELEISRWSQLTFHGKSRREKNSNTK